MAGYLDQYGAGDEKRIRIIKTLVISVVAAAILGSIGFFYFHNYRQERQAARFLDLLKAHNYQAAYETWARTEAERRAYPYAAFLRDWGPESAHPDVSSSRIVRSRSCGSGVVLTVDFGRGQPEKLWVERDNLALSFAPECTTGCPSALPPCFAQQP